MKAKKLKQKKRKDKKIKKQKHWTEDPETEFECVRCGKVWKLKESISCPKCDGINKIKLK